MHDVCLKVAQYTPQCTNLKQGAQGFRANIQQPVFTARRKQAVQQSTTGADDDRTMALRDQRGSHLQCAAFDAATLQGGQNLHHGKAPLR